MAADFPQVGVITNVIAYPILLQIPVYLAFSGKRLRDLEGLDDGRAVGLSSPQVVDLAGPGGLDEGRQESCHIEGMDVVPHLLPLVAHYLVLNPLQVAFDEVAEESMELDPGMIRTGQAPAPEAAGRNVEIPPIFLDHDVGGAF